MTLAAQTIAVRLPHHAATTVTDLFGHAVHTGRTLTVGQDPVYVAWRTP